MSAPDRETVIRGLLVCSESWDAYTSPGADCSACPYCRLYPGVGECRRQLMRDALAVINTTKGE